MIESVAKLIETIAKLIESIEFIVFCCIFVEMLNLYVKEMMRKRGLDPTPYTLMKYGISQFMAYKLINNKVKNLNLETLAQLCLILDCTPNDILDFQPKQGSVPNNVALFQIKKEPVYGYPADYFRLIPVEELKKRTAFLEQMAKKPETK